MRIAVTGGIAEGKSTVMRYLRELGHETASADEFARDVFHLDSVQEAIAARLGVSGQVDPAILRREIAASSDLRRWLNALTHPMIRERMDRCEHPWFEVPLLIEACLQSRYDRVWVVTCGATEQMRRLTERLGDADAARRMVGTQLPTEVKLSFADEVIRTNAPEDNVMAYVRLAAARELSK